MRRICGSKRKLASTFGATYFYRILVLTVRFKCFGFCCEAVIKVWNLLKPIWGGGGFEHVARASLGTRRPTQGGPAHVHLAVGQNPWDPILGLVNSPPILGFLF